MSPPQKLMIVLYRFFSTSFGKLLLKMLSFGIYAGRLDNASAKNYPFLVVITCDTESGYVAENERRVWQMEAPNAFIGFYYGIRNIVKILKKHSIKATFFLSTQCFSSAGQEYQNIKQQLRGLLKNGHEIGLHLHPDSDFSIQKKLSKKLRHTSAFFYDFKEKQEIIRAAKSLIAQNLGKNGADKMVSFRWGNWALDSDGAKALKKLGFKVDSSATPGIKGHIKDGMKYDWSRVQTHYPWKLSTKDYQDTTNNNSGIAEIPIATFDFFGIKLRADPVNSVLLNKAFEKYYEKAARSRKPFPFVVITHSSECTYNDGSITTALKDLDLFISYAKEFEGVEFVTLKEAYKGLGLK